MVTFVAAARTWLACAFRRFASLFLRMIWSENRTPLFGIMRGGGAIFPGVVVVGKARARSRRENDFCCLQTHIREIPLSTFGRHFSVSDRRGNGVSCDQTGLFVGGVSLLEPCRNCAGFQKWRPRPMGELNRDLSKRYGVPVEFDGKLEAIAKIAGALGRGDMLAAHIATLHLQIPDPPPPANAAQSASEVLALAKQLHARGLLKRGWDPAKHPRWPAGSPDSVGGRFAPSDTAFGDAPESESSVPITTVQALPIPFDAVAPRGAIPWPSEIVPPLGIHPRRELVNPFPDDPECEQEWADALLYCWKLKERKQLGKGDNRGSGRTFEQCVRGRVTERCGGSPTA
jgi:hypothetical protein